MPATNQAQFSTVMERKGNLLEDTALRIVTDLYVRGEFGDEDRDAEWLLTKAHDLAQDFEGCLQDWEVKQASQRCQTRFEL